MFLSSDLIYLIFVFYLYWTCLLKFKLSHIFQTCLIWHFLDYILKSRFCFENAILSLDFIPWSRPRDLLIIEDSCLWLDLRSGYLWFFHSPLYLSFFLIFQIQLLHAIRILIWLVILYHLVHDWIFDSVCIWYKFLGGTIWVDHYHAKGLELTQLVFFIRRVLLSFDCDLEGHLMLFNDFLESICWPIF